VTSATVVVVAAAVIARGSRVLVTRRLAGTHLAELWEFPGGKVEAGETLEACLTRELREELDVGARVGPEVLRTEHAYPDRIVRLHFHECAIDRDPAPVLGQQMQWIERRDLPSLAFPPADAELIAILARDRS
jgi:8-oxo-dGTP diphosphatase